jgi:hypothetical protein
MEMHEEEEEEEEKEEKEEEEEEEEEQEAFAWPCRVFSFEKWGYCDNYMKQ